MTAHFNDKALIGTHSKAAPTAAQAATMHNYDTGLGNVGHDVMHEFGPDVFEMVLRSSTAENANTVPSPIWVAPFALRIWAVYGACESAAGSAATVDVQVDPAGGTTFATILDGAIDVKTTAGTAVKGAILDGSQDIPVGATMKMVGIGTGAGAVVGSVARLICQRL